MPFILLIFSLAFSASAMEPSDPCEKILARSTILTRFKNELPAVKTLGLPGRHRDMPVLSMEHFINTPISFPSYRVSTEALFKIIGNQVLMPSDFGPTLWERKELESWLSLADNNLLMYEEKAGQEIAKILKNKGYCTPGISTYLCEELRFSYSGGGRLNSEEQKQPMNFGWQASATIGATMSPAVALSTLRIFAREALLRRVIYRNVWGKMERGAQLPVETKLNIATFPILLHALPALHEIPFMIEPDHRVGVVEPIALFSFRYLKSDVLVLITPEPYTNPHGVLKALLVTDDVELDRLEMMNAKEEFLDNFQHWLNLNAAAMQILMDKPSIKVSLHRETAGEVDIQIRGIDTASQLLFYHYLQTRPQVVSP
jgi:hypothetical protein